MTVGRMPIKCLGSIEPTGVSGYCTDDPGFLSAIHLYIDVIQILLN